MTLSALIRKRENATATVAAPVTHKGEKAGTVANVASVAVANPPEAEKESTVRCDPDREIWQVYKQGRLVGWLVHMSFAEAVGHSQAKWGRVELVKAPVEQEESR